MLQRVPHARPTDAGAPLERLPLEGERPHLLDAEVVEDATVRAHPVPGTPASAFAGFLDGTQESRVVGWIGAAPVVVGRVAAAIRVRRERRLCTWSLPVTEERVYVPFAYVPVEAVRSELTAETLVDTAFPDADGVLPGPHPLELLERAKSAVSRDRERVERRLAEAWCRERAEPLFIDGAIGGSESVARARCAVGVIKSHRSLYVTGDALAVVVALRAGERSSVVRITPRGRTSVYSWYLRLRDTAGHDALWGLVRVEVAGEGEPTARADDVSRWVLAESRPLSAPDARWDKMAYAVRNTEDFLRAIT